MESSKAVQKLIISFQELWSCHYHMSTGQCTSMNLKQVFIFFLQPHLLFNITRNYPPEPPKLSFVLGQDLWGLVLLLHERPASFWDILKWSLLIYPFDARCKAYWSKQKLSTDFSWFWIVILFYFISFFQYLVILIVKYWWHLKLEKERAGSSVLYISLDFI